MKSSQDLPKIEKPLLETWDMSLEDEGKNFLSSSLNA